MRSWLPNSSADVAPVRCSPVCALPEITREAQEGPFGTFGKETKFVEKYHLPDKCKQFKFVPNLKSPFSCIQGFFKCF